MTHRAFGQPVRDVTALESAHKAPAAPGIRSRHEGTREPLHVIHLEREAAEGVAREGVESGRDEHEVRGEAGGRGIYAGFERIQIAGRRQARPERDVPNTSVRTSIFGRAGAGIPGPPVHRDEVNVGLHFYERLRSVAVMHVPIDDEDALQSVFRARVMRGARNAPENAEAHRTIAQRVVTGRPNGAKAARVRTGGGAVNGIENASRRGGGGEPASLACHSVDIEAAAALGGDALHQRNVRGIVTEGELIRRCVTAFHVLDPMEKVRIGSERASDGAKTAHVLGVSPAGVVPSAIAV